MTEKTETVVTAYKAFNADWTCRGFQFEVGKTYEMEGPIVACERGFHACTFPADIWSYYDIGTSKIARVSVTDPVSHSGDSKVASAKITIEAELSIPEWIGETVKAVFDLCGKAKKKDGLTDAASGYASKLAASGDASKLAASGDGSTLAASGYASTLAASGYASKLAASGNDSTLAASGNDSTLAASGYASIVMGAGYGCRAKAGASGAIALTWYDGKRPQIAVGLVGEDGIKPDTWYEVRDGKLAECAP